MGGLWGIRCASDERGDDGRQPLDPSIRMVGRWQGEGCVDLGVGHAVCPPSFFVSEGRSSGRPAR
jgi:hypothetical protein